MSPFSFGDGDVSEPTTNGNGRKLISWQTIIGWAGAALLAYGAVEARVRVLEDRYERIVNDISEIKSDVKTLIRNRP